MAFWFCCLMCVVQYLYTAGAENVLRDDHRSTRFQIWMAAAIILGSLT